LKVRTGYWPDQGYDDECDDEACDSHAKTEIDPQAT